MTLDLLCKVVDNYGDIGVVYRLARSLAAAEPKARLRLHVDDIAAFKALAPALDASLHRQSLGPWDVLDWSLPAEAFAADPPRLVIECFACGRPAGLETALFDPARTDLRRIVNLEHLTAEPWARDFHRLPSATRSALVRKAFFMPGFETGTGGLLLDPGFRSAAAAWEAARAAGPAALAAARLAWAVGVGLPLSPALAARPWLSVFSYERDYAGIVADLARLPPARRPLALVAAGRSEACFLDAWRAAGQPFEALALPFLPQETWDGLLLAADLSIVRGEESLARATLAGRPFLWHAYLQNEDGDRHQLVKVRALLDLLRPHFPSEAFAGLETLWLAFNDRERDSPESGGTVGLSPLNHVLGASLPAAAPGAAPGPPLGPLPGSNGRLEHGFASFSRSLFALGDLGANLLTFIREMV